MHAEDGPLDERQHFSSGNRDLIRLKPADRRQNERIRTLRTASTQFGRKLKRSCSPGNLTDRYRSLVETEADYGTAFLFVPVCLAIGTIAYFSIDTEPGWSPILLGIATIVGVTTLCRRNRHTLHVTLAALLVLTGMLAAKVETWRLDTKMLGSAVATTLTGRIVAIERQSASRARLTIDLISTDKPRLRYAPDRVRLVARKMEEGILPGSTVTGRARLLPHSGPLYPDGFDFTFHNYFRGIGSTGFFMGAPRLIESDVSASPGMPDRLQRTRDWLTRRIKSQINGPEGDVAAALITGAKSGIPEPINEALRRTGLAHILSISGLHMALVAGTVLAALRLLFAMSIDFSSRHPVRKYAAAAALLTVFFYLFISGNGIATQRSFLMLAVMLIAVMLDRPAVTMRNLAIAAILIIALQPHEVVGPGFQMSFAATAALVAVYSTWSRRDRRSNSNTLGETGALGSLQFWLRKLVMSVLALAATSLIAGLATAVFGIWHFHRLAPLGLFANLAAMPIVSLVVMPAAVAAVALVPFGLDGFAFAIMGKGIGAVISIAEWFSERSPIDQIGLVPAPSVLLATAGLVMATLPVSRLRIVSALFFAIALIVGFNRSIPDVLVSEDGKMIAVRTGDGLLAVNRNRPRQFTFDGWKRALAAERSRKPAQGEVPLSTTTIGDVQSDVFICADGLCLLRMSGGAVIAHAETADDARPVCGIATVIIVATAFERQAPCRSSRQLSPDVTKGRGPMVINARDLARGGSVSLSIMRDRQTGPNGGVVGGAAFAVVFKQAIQEPWRPWHSHRAFSREARGLPPIKRKRDR